MAKNNLIYNFSGYPGDLIQLMPDKFLATLASALNNKYPDSTEVWDRGQADVMRQLSPRGPFALLFRVIGKRFFHLSDSGRSNFVVKILFGMLSLYMEKRRNSITRKYINQDVDRIISGGFRVVFLNLWQGPGFGDSIYLASQLKKKQKTLKIYGIGHRITWVGKAIAFVSKSIDAYIMGTHSYKSMLELADGRRKHDIPNLFFWEGEKIVETDRVYETDFQEVPFPEYAPNVYRGIESKIPLYEIPLSNEACPFKCNFCVRPVNYGTSCSVKTGKRIVDEVEFHAVKYKARMIRFSDSTPPAGLLTAVAGEMLNRGFPEKYGIEFSAFSRVYTEPKEDFALLKKAGFKALFFGIESGSQDVLDRVFGKKSKIVSIYTTIKHAHSAGIFVVGSFIYPSPGETDKSRDETIKLLQDLNGIVDSVLVQPAGVYPNTEWHKNPSKYGISLDDDYIQRVSSYPIEPLKPIIFWKPFPFRYALMNKPEERVSFKDICKEFMWFYALLHKSRQSGGLGYSSIQDYGYLMARYYKKDPAMFSKEITRGFVLNSPQFFLDQIS
jgi:hypothetical protein